MRHGVRIKINVSKIDKALLFKGAKGAYLDATVFIDTENKSEYGDHGIINQDVSKEARDNGEKGNLLGNVTVFWSGESDNKPSQPQQQQSQQAPPIEFDDLEDLPF